MSNRRQGEPPERPCVAYFKIAEVVDASYFVQSPPPSGMVLKATHRADRTTSVWYMTALMARSVESAVSRVTGLSVLLEPFDGHMPLEAG